MSGKLSSVSWQSGRLDVFAPGSSGTDAPQVFENGWGLGAIQKLAIHFEDAGRNTYLDFCLVARVGRSLRDLITMLDDLIKRGVKFRSLPEHIDTERLSGRAMWQMIGLLAELEGSLISERTRAGVKTAQRRGV